MPTLSLSVALATPTDVEPARIGRAGLCERIGFFDGQMRFSVSSSSCDLRRDSCPQPVRPGDPRRRRPHRRGARARRHPFLVRGVPRDAGEARRRARASDHDDLDRADVTEMCSHSTEAVTCAEASSSNRRDVFELPSPRKHDLDPGHDPPARGEGEVRASSPPRTGGVNPRAGPVRTTAVNVGHKGWPPTPEVS